MKALIDLGTYDDKDYIEVEVDNNGVNVLQEDFEIIALGEFISKETRHFTLMDLMQTIRPPSPGEAPTIESAEKAFADQLEYRKQLAGTTYMISCWCKNSQEHLHHLIESYQENVKRTQLWNDKLKRLGIPT